MLLGKIIKKKISLESKFIYFHQFSSINFQRIMPKANIFKSSEVFKHLNEEAIKTKADKDKEVKRWTTFLQKPNRPVPVPKWEQDKPYQEPYRVKIVKQPKPKCDPKRTPTPPQIFLESSTHEVEPVQNEAPNVAAPNASEIDISNIHDDDVPELEVCDTQPEQEISEIENVASNEDKVEELFESVNGSNTDAETEADVGLIQGENDDILSISESALEKQLADVQKQLEALSHLPSTIQATLEAVTKQIAEIMPAFKIRTSVDITGSLNEEQSIKLTEEFDAEQDSTVEIEHTDANVVTNTAETNSISNDVRFKEHSHAVLEVSTTVPERQPSPAPGIPIKREQIASPFIPRKTELSFNDLAEITEEQVTRLKVEKVFLEQEEKWLREREKEHEREREKVCSYH